MSGIPIVVNHCCGGVHYLWRTLYINSYGKGFGNEPYLSMVVRFLKWNWKQNFISFGSFNLHTNNDLEFQDDPWWVFTPDYTGYHVNYILQYGWNGYLVIMLPILQNGLIQTTMELSQLSWNHFIGKMEWSKWTKWKMVHLLLSKSTWNFRVQAKAYIGDGSEIQIFCK